MPAPMTMAWEPDCCIEHSPFSRALLARPTGSQCEPAREVLAQFLRPILLREKQARPRSGHSRFNSNHMSASEGTLDPLTVEFANCTGPIERPGSGPMRL